jgi:hypothetical protein
MFSIGIFNSESRRSGIDRRQSNVNDSSGNEKRGYTDRRSNEDRRSNTGRRAGVYYEVTDEHRDIVEKIILSMESKNWANW